MESITRSTPACHYDAVHAAEIREALALTLTGLIRDPDGRGGCFDCETRVRRDDLETAGRIKAFLHNAHATALYSPCCEVSATVLLVRIYHSNAVAITGANWRAMMFVAIMVSQKLVDDISLPNSEFVALWGRLLDKPDASGVIVLTLPELNRMETQLCKLLHWDIGLASDTFWAAVSAVAKVADEIRAAPTAASDTRARTTNNDTSNADDTMPAITASPTTSDALELTWDDKQCLLPDLRLTSQHTTGGGVRSKGVTRVVTLHSRTN
jgi:hypothetical protein